MVNHSNGAPLRTVTHLCSGNSRSTYSELIKLTMNTCSKTENSEFLNSEFVECPFWNRPQVMPLKAQTFKHGVCFLKSTLQFICTQKAKLGKSTKMQLRPQTEAIMKMNTCQQSHRFSGLKARVPNMRLNCDRADVRLLLFRWIYNTTTTATTQ